MTYHLISYQNKKPWISDNVYISQGVCIIGEVVIGENSGIWFNSVLRGDLAPIIIGCNTNIQDNSVIHTSRFENGGVIIGNNVTVGHMAIIHACKIMDHAFIGMRANVMDDAVIEEYGFVAAGALIAPRKIVKSRELWAGVPAKFIRHITDEEVKQMQATTDNYVKLAKQYLV